MNGGREQVCEGVRVRRKGEVRGYGYLSGCALPLGT